MKSSWGISRHASWFLRACVTGLVAVLVLTLSIPEKGVFAAAIYAAASWFIGMPLVLYDTIRLQRYLERVHPDKWAGLVERRGGFGVPWALAVDRFARALDDLGDPHLGVLIRNVLFTRRLPYLLVLHYPIVIGGAVYFSQD